MTAMDMGKPQQVLLLVTSQPIVAEDIALTLGDEWPGAQIVLARDLEDGLRAIAGFAAVALAVIETEAVVFAVSPLRPALSVKGARVCLLGSRDGGQWPTLPMPFTTDALLLALKTIAPLP